jgi:signal transduction histidine kinase
MVMTGPASPPRRIGHLPTALVLLFSLALTGAASVATRRAEERRWEGAFRQLAARPVAAVQESIYLHIGDLESIGSFYAASRLVERDEFRSFVAGVLARRPGIAAVEWAPRLPARQRASFEAAGPPGFRITELDARGRRVPAGRREVYYPIWYAEPDRVEEAQLGLDLASDPGYHQALLRAAARGGVSATGPLLAAAGDRPGAYVGLVLPIRHYRGQAAVKGDPQGYVVLVLRVADLVERALAKTAPEGVAVSLYDERAGAHGVQLYPRAGPATTDPERELASGTSYGGRLQVAGREWVMVCRPSAKGLPRFRDWASWAVLGIGLLFSGLLTAYVASVVGRVSWAERLVGERTAELSNANDRLQGEVTERRRAQSDLAARNRELESFVYMASHDLRTPLTSIEGFTRLLEESYADRLDADGREFLQRVQENAAHMTALVEDLLELSRVTSNQEPKGTVTVAEVIAQVCEELQQAIAESGAEITVPDDLPVVHASPTRLRQVFTNLISNGIKFSRDGVAPRVAIGWERTPEGHRFSVQDNGIGIAHEQRGQVFEIFSRLKDKDVSGTGIGLAIVKRIVESHGGEVGVESTPGEGSTFWFTVPENGQESATGDRGSGTATAFGAGRECG